MAGKRRSDRKEIEPLTYDIVGVALIALGVLIFMGLIRPESGLGLWLAMGLRYLLGIGAWMAPPAVIFLGILGILRREHGWTGSRLCGLAIFFAVILCFADMTMPGDTWDAARFFPRGGLAGAFTVWLLTPVLRPAGIYVVGGAALLISLLLIFNLSLAAILAYFADILAGLREGGERRQASDQPRTPRPARNAPPVTRPAFDPPVVGQTPEKPIRIKLMDDGNAGQTELPLGGESGRASLAVSGASAEKKGQPEPWPPGPDMEPVSYSLPAASLLAECTDAATTADRDLIAGNAALLEKTLESFGIAVKVVAAEQGPAITRYELQPAPGVKVNSIVNLSSDIALSLAASNIRIEAPIPGKSAVGIEVPNPKVSVVRLRELIESAPFTDGKSRISFALGKDIGGAPIVADLARMPHLLIAGATGTGKSVCINALIMSLLFKATPSQLRLVMIDPKRVELNIYQGLPHLAMPVIQDAKQAAAALKWVIKQMEARYELFAAQGVRNIDGYNGRNEDGLPYIVVIIDELADLMLVAPMDVENSICRLAQLARATGIHLVVATQRPSVDIITGTIKANIASRISFAVASQIDSRTILDAPGAEKLMGRGDMLYQPVDRPKPIRLQGAFVAEEEIERVVQFIKKQGRISYLSDVPEAAADTDEISLPADADDDLFAEAVRHVVNSQQASITMLQRRLKVGYARAARLVDIMEERGIVGPFEGSKAREVLVGPEYLDNADAGKG